MKLIKNKDNLRVLSLLALISIVCGMTNYNGNIDNYNTTILALNYSYGFTSRGFIGTIYLLLDKILPFDIYNSWGSLKFYQLSTALFIMVLFAFAIYILNKAGSDNRNKVVWTLVFLFICSVSTFTNEFNFGRIDMYMIIISLLGVMLIISEKAEWLVIPMAAIGVMIHQGYIMMYFNIILVLLWYQIFSKDNKSEKIKYGVIFIVSTFVAAVLFLYLELFSHAANGPEIYQQVANIASSLAADGTYHKTLLAHELLGVDLSEVEHSMHMKNLCEIIIFVLALIPFVIGFIKLFVRIWKKSNSIWEKLMYLGVFGGPITMFPDFLIKVDYGRWVLSVTVYYLVILVVMLCIDQRIYQEVSTLVKEVKVKYSFWQLFFIYPALFVPFFDVNINQITAIVGHVLNRELLHWW